MHGWNWAIYLVIIAFLVPTISVGDPSPNVEIELEERDADIEDPGYTHLGRGILARGLEGYDEFRSRINEDHGLNWLVDLSYMYQQRDGSGGNRWTHNSELDFLVQWDLVDSKRFGKGSLTYMLTYVWENRDFFGFGSGASRDQVTPPGIRLQKRPAPCTRSATVTIRMRGFASCTGHRRCSTNVCSCT